MIVGRYESSVAFGMRKALQAEQGKSDMENRIVQLEGEKKVKEGGGEREGERNKQMRERGFEIAAFVPGCVTVPKGNRTCTCRMGHVSWVLYALACASVG